jgi:hypothetical protein
MLAKVRYGGMQWYDCAKGGYRKLKISNVANIDVGSTVPIGRIRLRCTRNCTRIVVPFDI